MSTQTINLNADLGESFGVWSMGADEELLKLVNSANIACGFHAGDPMVMRRTLRAAIEAGVDLGAHPSYPDLQGFGRRSMRFSAQEIEAMLIYQIGALDGLARAEGARLAHVKPHGALNNDACTDRARADAIARAIKSYDKDLMLLAPARSLLVEAGREAGLRVVEEVFADRAYGDDGALLARGLPGAVLRDARSSLAHVEAMLAAQGIVTLSGKVLKTRLGSICIHADGAEAVASASALRQKLTQAGYQLRRLGEL